jgi:hypothetical protein
MLTKNAVVAMHCIILKREGVIPKVTRVANNTMEGKGARRHATASQTGHTRREVWLRCLRPREKKTMVSADPTS